jgi:alkylation response protein AidB-like acyl-CoA dehydrogenase
MTGAAERIRPDGLTGRVARFIAERVVPAEADLDAARPGVFAELRRAARAEGLWALPLPTRYGGAGLPLAEYLAVAEHEGASDHGPDVLNSTALLTVRMLLEHAEPRLAEELVPALVAGDAKSCYAMTEPDAAGSDPATVRTTAELGADGMWTITGRKWFITGAGDADWAIVLARTDPDAPPREAFSLFLVPALAEGFRVVGELDVLGGGGQHELALDRVRVPGRQLLGEVGAGLRLAGARLGLGRTLRALRWVGQGQRALNLLGVRAAHRRFGAGMLADQQLVQRLMFEGELGVRSARELARRAAASVANGERATVEVSLAKVAAARALHTAVDAAIQVYGAEGLTAASDLPRLLRWARAARIMDGAEELLVSGTGARLLRDHR